MAVLTTGTVDSGKATLWLSPVPVDTSNRGVNLH